MNTLDTFVCPKGHASSEPDYCSECGARIGDEAGASGAGAVTGSAATCPECGAAREQLGIVFCEICGYNFETGARGGDPVIPAPALIAAAPAPAANVSAAMGTVAAPAANVSAAVGTVSAPAASVAAPAGKAKAWQVVVSVDSTLRDPQSPEAPIGVVPVTVPLGVPVSLIGRRSQARAIFPEIDLSQDSAVSHRHGLLQVDAAGGLTLRDIGASNGTRLNHQMVEPLKDHALADGDEITLGHWSRLVVKAVN